MASGYKRLPAGARYSLKLRETLTRQADRAEPIQQLLIHYEDSRDEMLIDAMNQLIHRQTDRLQADQRIYQLLLQTLGAPGPQLKATDKPGTAIGEIPFEL